MDIVHGQKFTDIPEWQISECRWQSTFYSDGASARFNFCMLAYPESAMYEVK